MILNSFTGLSCVRNGERIAAGYCSNVALTTSDVEVLAVVELDALAQRPPHRRGVHLLPAQDQPGQDGRALLVAPEHRVVHVVEDRPAGHAGLDARIHVPRIDRQADDQLGPRLRRRPRGPRKPATAPARPPQPVPVSAAASSQTRSPHLDFRPTRDSLAISTPPFTDRSQLNKGSAPSAGSAGATELVTLDAASPSRSSSTSTAILARHRRGPSRPPPTSHNWRRGTARTRPAGRPPT